METPVVRNSLGEASKSVGNPLLSERDGNGLFDSQWPNTKIHVGNPLLSERDGNSYASSILCIPTICCRKPTTL